MRKKLEESDEHLKFLLILRLFSQKKTFKLLICIHISIKVFAYDLLKKHRESF